MTPDHLRKAIEDAEREKRHLGEAEIVLAVAPLLLELWEVAADAPTSERFYDALADLEDV